MAPHFYPTKNAGEPKNFRYNFGDSEQGIRLFLAKNFRELYFDLISRKLDFSEIETRIDLFEKLDQKCSAIKKIYEDTIFPLKKQLDTYEKFDAYSREEKLTKNQEKFLDENKDLSEEDIKELINKKEAELIAKEKEVGPYGEKVLNDIISKLSFRLEMSSYLIMCGNCQATFKYLISEKKVLQRDMFSMFLSGLGQLSQKNVGNLTWFLKSRFNGKTLVRGDKEKIKTEFLQKLKIDIGIFFIENNNKSK